MVVIKKITEKPLTGAGRTWTFEVPGRAVGKGRPRARRIGRGVQMYTDEKTMTAEAWIRQCGHAALGQLGLTGPLSLSVVVVVAVPGSWPAHKRQAASGGLLKPMGKPDLDNIVKSVGDALNGVLWLDDSQIAHLSAIKVYGALPQMQITISELS